jgi:hypothetical protein
MKSILRRIIAISVAALVLGGGAYVALRGGELSTGPLPPEFNLSVSSTTPPLPAPPALPAAPEAPRTPPPGWLEYRDTRYGFSLFYPKELSVERFENGSAVTIVFQSVHQVQGFQIYIQPYLDTKISEERFKKDEPTGARQDARNVSVGGVPAVSFYSVHPTLGDTAEVWFIHNSQLYEATSLKPLSAWFADIMQTWRFM